MLVWWCGVVWCVVCGDEMSRVWSGVVWLGAGVELSEDNQPAPHSTTPPACPAPPDSHGQPGVEHWATDTV